jgi:hypothetical protein
MVDVVGVRMSGLQISVRGPWCAVGRVFRILKRVGGVGHGVLGIGGSIIEGSSGRG